MNLLPTKKIIFWAVCSGIILLNSWVSYVSFQYPYLGIGLSQNENSTWYVSELFEGGLAKKSGIAINDIIQTVNGLTPSEHPSILNFHKLEQAVSIEILRNDNILHYDLSQIPNTFTSRFIAGLLAGILLFSIAIILLIRVKDSQSGKYLVTTFIMMGISFICAEASSQTDILSKIIIHTTLSLIPYVFFLFIYYFLTQKGYKLYSYPKLRMIFILLFLMAIVRFIYFFDLHLYTYSVIDRTLTLVCFAVGCLIVLHLLLSIYRKNRLEYSFSALIIKIILLSFSASFVPYLLFTVIPDLIGTAIVYYSDANWFIILFPLSFIYFAAKYKLLEHAPFLRSLFGRHHEQVLSFNRLLSEYGRTNTLNEWEKQLFPQFCKILHLEAIGLRIKDQGVIRLNTYGSLDESEFVHAFANGQQMENGYQLYAIQSKFEFTSHLMIKRKLPLKSIYKEQQLCIDVLIAWLSITLENMYLSEKLSLKVENLMTETAAAAEQSGEHALWFRKTLYQMQEKERRRIASELHDTVMQDIYFARQRITSIRNSASLPAHTDEQLAELSEYLDVINSSLRDANFQLYPHLLREVGFAQTISSLIEDERVHASFQLILRIEQKTEWEQLDSDTHHHLFRIIQELLSNARKHAGAELVQFRLYYKKGCFVMEYRDDGAGFDLHLEQEGAGLRNIQHRVLSLDGSLKLNTAVLQGLQLTLSLPDKPAYLDEQDK